MAEKLTLFQKMVNLSKWRFGIGHECKGFGGVMLFCLYCLLNLFWYIALGVLWVLFSVFFVICLVPAKMLKKQYKSRSKRIDIDRYGKR
ncbi:MAG: hypothetical protein IJA88_00475 [Clostridia bacterium]|nr:hypothetical protein [Clostridia bacterium]